MKEYNELHLKYRPSKLSEVVGQATAIASIEKMLADDRLPHSVLFTGPAGTGKTTLARILARELDCHELDLSEINAADDRGIDMARQLIEDSRLRPMGGNVKCYVIDECHQLVAKRGGDAQTTLLKVIEEPPHHCYFFACTTHPEELLPTLRQRFTEVKLSPIPNKTLIGLVHDVALKENKPFTEDVYQAVATAASGSARNALKMLAQVIDLDEDDALALLQPDKEEDDRVGQLLRAMLYEKVDWPTCQKIIATMPSNEDWESFRYKLLAGAEKVLLSPRGQHARACALIDYCRDSWRECRRAGLLSACYAIFSRK